MQLQPFELPLLILGWRVRRRRIRQLAHSQVKQRLVRQAEHLSERFPVPLRRRMAILTCSRSRGRMVAQSQDPVWSHCSICRHRPRARPLARPPLVPPLHSRAQRGRRPARRCSPARPSHELRHPRTTFPLLLLSHLGGNSSQQNFTSDGLGRVTPTVWWVADRVPVRLPIKWNISAGISSTPASPDNNSRLLAERGRMMARSPRPKPPRRKGVPLSSTQIITKASPSTLVMSFRAVLAPNNSGEIRIWTFRGLRMPACIAPICSWSVRGEFLTCR